MTTEKEIPKMSYKQALDIWSKLHDHYSALCFDKLEKKYPTMDEQLLWCKAEENAYRRKEVAEAWEFAELCHKRDCAILWENING